MRYLKANKGITLIALVITIIVLLILAGVTIFTLFGKNGLITTAQKANEEAKKGEAKERIRIEVLGSCGVDGKIDVNELKENLKNNLGTTIKEVDETIIVKYKGYNYLIDYKNNEIIEIDCKKNGHFYSNGICTYCGNWEYGEGEGTESNPYKIANVNQFIQFKNFIDNEENNEGIYWQLQDNINLSEVCGENLGVNWMPIGKKDWNSKAIDFKGTFDGNNYTIQNLYIQDTTNTHNGALFWNLNSATIKNVKLTGQITVNIAYAGGVSCGARFSKIYNCTNEINLSGNNRAGGIVGGDIVGTVIENCWNKGNITGKYAGGIADGYYISGYEVNNYVRKCYNSGNITTVVSSGTASGIMNASSVYFYIENCYSSGNISGSSNIAGVSVTYSNRLTKNYYLKNNNFVGSGIEDVTGRVEAVESTEGNLINTFEQFYEWILTK